MKKFVLLLAAAVITCSIGHQISGGYKGPKKSGENITLHSRYSVGKADQLH